MKQAFKYCKKLIQPNSLDYYIRHLECLKTEYNEYKKEVHLKINKTQEITSINLIKIETYKKFINEHTHPDLKYISPLIELNDTKGNIETNKRLGLEQLKYTRNLRTKTCDISTFKEYITYKNYAHQGEYGDLYKDLIFRKCKWYSYIDKCRSTAKLLNRIEAIFGPRETLTIIYGDWSVGQSLRNCKPTPQIGLKREIHKRFRMYNIDEFRTSMLSYKNASKCTNLIVPDKTGQLRSLHAVLTYPMDNRISCVNRNYNAVNNMKLLTESFLVNEPRPERYRRGFKLDTQLITSNPMQMALSGGPALKRQHK